MKYKNVEGYHDPTAGIALQRVTKEEQNRVNDIRDLINTLKYISGLAGFEIVGRVTFKDKETGRRYT